jgi:predicted phosphatase
MSEKLPISDKLSVLGSVTLYKTTKWWATVALLDSFGRKQVALYLWLNKEGKWKRNQKYIIHSREEWNRIKEAVEKFVSQLT